MRAGTAVGGVNELAVCGMKPQPSSALPAMALKGAQRPRVGNHICFGGYIRGRGNYG